MFRLFLIFWRVFLGGQGTDDREDPFPGHFFDIETKVASYFKISHL